ncbi:BTAD domain-containing putative transcriptional regulator [Spongiactinospora sp. 9N601]|uniref:BTAD domain-containing putative transcriptional regulator n=1 Tax=Spongiactinospora sp. 9N601 TaxID=3375149 RepID=UPI0037BAEDCD
MIRFLVVVGRVLAVCALLIGVEVGIPVMLVRFAGWPLPRAIPTGGDIEAFLMNPISEEVLLKALACPLWLLWGAFTAALVVEAAAAVRGVEIHVPMLGPLQGIAAGLIGSLSFAMLPIEAEAASFSTPGRPVVDAPQHVDPRTHVVKKGDSLWSIAKHELGESRSWRKIWKLNAHRRQVDGQMFTDPEHIHPGWKLRLPELRPEAITLDHTRSVALIPEAQPSAAQPVPAKAQTEDLGGRLVVTINVPSGAVIALSAASGVCAAYAAAQFHRRRRRRSDDPVRPPAVVQAARSAFFQPFRDQGVSVPSNGDLIRQMSSIEAPDRLVIGTHDDGTAAAVPLGGLSLGLTGPGSLDVVRALLLDLLHQAGNFRLEIIITTADAAAIVELDRDGLDALANRLPGVTLVDSPADRLEEIHFTRGRILAERDAADIDELRQRDPGELLPNVLLIGTIEDDTAARLQSLVTAGAQYGLGALLLGTWTSTCHIGPDHRATTAEGPYARPLHNASLVHLPAADLVDALRNLADAQPVDNAPDTPAPTATAIPWEHATPIRVRVLGKPAVWVKGHDQPLRIRGLKLLLLVYFALHPQGATKEAIGEALWPGKQLGHEFHSLLRHLRDALEKATGLTGEPFIQAMDDETYRIDSAKISYDLWDFQEAAKTARTTPDTRRDALAQAASLCGGELATGIHEDWVLDEKYPLTLAQVDVLTQFASLCQADDPERAVDALERARDIDPDAEETWCHLIRLLHNLGRPAQARHTGQLLRAHLHGLQVEPTSETEELLATTTTRSAPQGRRRSP